MVMLAKKTFVLEGWWGHMLVMAIKYLPGTQNPFQDAISAPLLWLTVTLVNLQLVYMEAEKLKSHQLSIYTSLFKRGTAEDKHHATSPRLIWVIKNCRTRTALQNDTGKLFCIIREGCQMVTQQQKLSKIHFLPWEILDWQLWKQVFYVSIGQDREGI